MRAARTARLRDNRTAQRSNDRAGDLAGTGGAALHQFGQHSLDLPPENLLYLGMAMMVGVSLWDIFARKRASECEAQACELAPKA